MANKRQQQMTPSMDSPKLKKIKTFDSTSIESMELDVDSKGWTKVEKRKQKKIVKAEVKAEVCLIVIVELSSNVQFIGNSATVHVQQFEHYQKELRYCN
jgi:hypothetical protein